jgi:Na+-driven multidrug efflux pump
MESHVKAVGIIHIAFGALLILLAILISAVLTLVTKLPDVDEEAIRILQIIAITVPWFFVVLSLPGIIGGIGLLKYQGWARIVVLILSFIELLKFPVGTAIGIYSIWVLLDKRTEKLFLKSKK